MFLLFVDVDEQSVVFDGHPAEFAAVQHGAVGRHGLEVFYLDFGDDAEGGAQEEDLFRGGEHHALRE